MSLQIRRGTNADRISITPEVGELLYTTDTNALYIGNGVVPGGILVSAGNTIYGNAQVQAFLASGNVNQISANSIGALSLSAVNTVFGGNVRTNNYQWGNGQPVSFQGNYSNANVQSYLPTYSGNLVSLTGNVTTTANIHGAYIFGNGSQLTGLAPAYANANVFSYLGSNSNVVITTTGNVKTTANIQGSYILGNGAFLTGLPAQYANSNVFSYLGSNSNVVITTTGNITTEANVSASYFLGNGALLTGLPVQYANSNVSSYLQGNFASNIIPSGNATQSLGNATHPFKDLWVSNSTIYIDAISLSASGNTLKWNSNAIPTLSGNLGNLNLGNGDVLANNLILTGGFNVTADSFISGNLTVGGNLDYTYINDLAVDDAIIFTAINNTTDSIDGGLVTQYSLGNGNIYTGFVRDHSTGAWTLFDDLPNIPTDIVDWANTAPGNLVLGTLDAVTILGDISGATGLANVAYTGNYSSLLDSPTNVSFFTNDANYITSAEAPVQSVNGQTGNVVLTIPTTTSNLINDSGFITTANANVITVNGLSGNVILDIPTTTSNLINDSGFITSAIANVITVNGLSGNVTLDIPTTTSNLINDSGFITTANANVISVNGQTGVVTIPTNDYSNANVQAYLPTYTGNLNGGNIYISGTANVGQEYVGNLFVTGNADLAGQMSANLIYANIFRGDGGQLSNIHGGNISGNISVTNITATGNANVTGNITGAYIYGNGAYLTGISVASQYGNANVAEYLASGNVTTDIITTANVSAVGLTISQDAVITGNLTIGANLNVVNVNEYVGATGNVSFIGNLIPGTDGNSYTLGITQIPWSNVYATYYHGDGSNLTGISGGGNSSIIQNGTSNVTIPVANSTVTINTDGTQSWQFNTAGELLLPAQNVSGSNGESAIFKGTRKIVNGIFSGATNPYSVTLNAGPTPTVAYTTSAMSTKVTFAIQSYGNGFQWEQFDVVATWNQDDVGTVNYAVSNRIKGSSLVDDTIVTATINGSNQIEISLTLMTGQSGWASFDAVEFGLMVD